MQTHLFSLHLVWCKTIENVTTDASGRSKAIYDIVVVEYRFLHFVNVLLSAHVVIVSIFPQLEHFEIHEENSLNVYS